MHMYTWYSTKCSICTTHAVLIQRQIIICVAVESDKFKDLTYVSSSMVKGESGSAEAFQRVLGVLLAMFM